MILANVLRCVCPIRPNIRIPPRVTRPIPSMPAVSRAFYQLSSFGSMLVFPTSAITAALKEFPLNTAPLRQKRSGRCARGDAYTATTQHHGPPRSEIDVKKTLRRRCARHNARATTTRHGSPGPYIAINTQRTLRARQRPHYGDPTWTTEAQGCDKHATGTAHEAAPTLQDTTWITNEKFHRTLPPRQHRL